MDRGTLAATTITKSYGAETILDGVSVAVRPGARIGVVGPNGSGKTTLLRLLAGVEEPDAGAVRRRPQSLTVGYLSQELDAPAAETVLRSLERRTGVAAAAAEMDRLADRLGSEPELAGAHADALERFLSLGGDDLPARAREVAARVGLGADRLDRPLSTLSGGESARAKLAAVLLSRFDVLLLDEPTNDLDFAGLELLERFVSSTPSALVVVSHDRAFLEHTVDRVLEFEAETRRIREFAGGWHEYERLRALCRKGDAAVYERYVAERFRFESLLRGRQGEARTAGKMADRRGTHALMSKVRAAERRLERLETVEKPWTPWRLQLSLESRRAGDVVARLEGAVVDRGRFRLGPVDLELRHGDRLAVVGPNGSGKTTLVRALAGELPLASGTRSVGPSVRFGRLEQDRAWLDSPRPLLELFRDATGLPPVEARTLLAKFSLRGADVARPAASLSPGERTRAILARLTAAGANALLLDEPTNHLDLEAIEQLEGALEDFEGALVVVSHDRRFLECLALSATVEL
ncbi:MAG TPA: ABC-F family ATP-binding cassette domain-containing protein [Gaiellaceae bacterium]|nr:ABC-F family ATP-binding cassette domain-containing protein [Gaiellaceae bacterium]